ncbi:Rab proteins geranylgeranyltransferase component A [Tulasnella sp. 403]|nr:Rab proteins geranylgeranyltransferase component A [Tulasnella sp. 403]
MVCPTPIRMDNPPEHWDVAILGTGLPESILAAALAKAGKKVLHLDENEYYGGDFASLSITELMGWASARSNTPPDPTTRPSEYLLRQRQQFSSISYSFPTTEASGGQTDPALISESRQYSISLTPTIIPATGPIIAALIGSGVSRYGGFCLLGPIGICAPAESPNPTDFELKRVPSSKEDVFKDRGMSLIEKRKLMKFLIFAGGDFEASNELRGQEDVPFVDFLQSKFGLSSRISAAIAFAVAHCTTIDDSTLRSLNRMQRYLRATGRYGNSPFLIGHYGGSGEIAQGFCRTAAVHGATYILGRKFESVSKHDKHPPPVASSPVSHEKREDVRSPIGPHYSIRLQGFLNPVTVDVVVATSSYRGTLDPRESLDAERTGPAASAKTTVLSRCIAILDGAIHFTSVQSSTGAESVESEEPDGTKDDTPHNALVIFPPTDTNGPVSALLLGETSLSCPAGKYVVYLTSLSSSESDQSYPSPSDLLEPYLNRLLQFMSLPQGDAPSTKPLFTLYYNQCLRHQRSTTSPPGKTNSLLIVHSEPTISAPLTESADDAAIEAERVFREVLKNFLDEEEVPGSEDLIPFWPAEDPDVSGSAGSQDDEW